MTTPDITPPPHLAPDTAAWFTHVVTAYTMEPHHTRLLTAACIAWDRAEQARQDIAEHGLTILDRFGVRKLNPAASVERDSAIRFARLVRELGLDVVDDSAPRPPALPGTKGR